MRVLQSFFLCCFFAVCSHTVKADSFKINETWQQLKTSVSEASDKVKKATEETLKKTVQQALGKQGGNALFYYPIPLSKHTPAKWGYAYEEVFFPSLDKTKLHGWFIPSVVKNKPSKGVIIYSHGNTGSMHSHFGFSYWLSHAGFDLFMYDYRGYGNSQGKPSRKGIVEDAQAALTYALQRKDWKNKSLIAFGHSLGATKNMAALAQMKYNSRIKCCVAWAGFASYVQIAQDLAGNFAKEVTSDEYAVRDCVNKIAPIPLLIVHGKKDKVIPFFHAQMIFEQAKKPKQLYLFENCGHNDTFFNERKKNRTAVLKWIEKQLQEKK